MKSAQRFWGSVKRVTLLSVYKMKMLATLGKDITNTDSDRRKKCRCDTVGEVSTAEDGETIWD